MYGGPTQRRRPLDSGLLSTRRHSGAATSGPLHPPYGASVWPCAAPADALVAKAKEAQLRRLEQIAPIDKDGTIRVGTHCIVHAFEMQVTEALPIRHQDDGIGVACRIVLISAIGHRPVGEQA